MKTNQLIRKGLVAGSILLFGATPGFSQSTAMTFQPPADDFCVNPTGRTFRAIARAHDVSVALDQTGALFSQTGDTDWVKRDSNTPSALHWITGACDMFVAVGNEGAIVTSTDGARWTARDSNTDERLRCVVYGNGAFVAVGYNGVIVTSKNGRTWTKRDSGVSDRLQGVAYGHGQFVAVGWNGCVLSSRDGIHWKRRARVAGNLHPITNRNGVMAVSYEACAAMILEGL